MLRIKEYGILGLESRDMRVYETLYTLGKASLRALAQATDLNRGTVYEIVKKLLNMGMITFTQVGERRHYTAAEPEVILALIQDRQDRLLELERTAKDYASQLRAGRQLSGNGYLGRFFEGDEGIAAILRDVLQTAVDQEPQTYRVISSQRVSNFIYTNFRSFSRQRVKLGLFVRVISDAPSGGKLALAERRQLSNAATPLNSYIIMYGNKTALISLSGTNELSGIVITDRGITGTQQALFERLWQELGPGA